MICYAQSGRRFKKKKTVRINKTARYHQLHFFIIKQTSFEFDPVEYLRSNSCILFEYAPDPYFPYAF